MFAAGWQAPETYGDTNHRARVYPASDVFGLSMVIYQVVSRKVPFDGMAAREIDSLVRLRFDPTAKSVVKKLKKGKSLDELKEEWLDDNELEDRRPDVDEVEEGCPKRLPGLMKKCWYAPLLQALFAFLCEKSVFLCMRHDGAQPVSLVASQQGRLPT